MRTFRIFVSSPGDVAVERRRAEDVVSRLNGEFAGLARLEAIRWETEYYRAHDTFQAQIPPASNCDVVVGILKWRLGTPLPPAFSEKLPDGEPYPSGTAYEILSAIEKRKHGADLPDVYVFRFTGSAPNPQLDDPHRAAIERDWAALRTFIHRWFETPEGHFTAAFNPYRSEDDFEIQLESMLRKWLAAKVAGGRHMLWPPVKGSPFRGLAAFGAKHAPVFFGRSNHIRRAVDLWRGAAQKGTPFLLVVGASGAGKSSLARAGLLPRLATPGVVPEVDIWRVAVMRPGDNLADPFRGLAVALLAGEADLPAEEEGRGAALPEIAEGDSKTPADLAAVLAHGDAGAARPILNALARVAERARAGGHYERAVRCDLVLLIDQLEELFAESLGKEGRAGFARLLGRLAESGRIWITATLRADAYASLLDLQELRDLKDKGAAYDLAPPGTAELAEIVRGPAAAAGLSFEKDPATGEGLDERLLREADRPDMLPLVELALSRLYDGRKAAGEEILLPLDTYINLGGLEGIIDEAGERALSGLNEAARARLPALVRQLAEASHSGGPLTIRAAPLAAAAPDEAGRTLVDALVAARLLTLGGGDNAPTLRLAHQRVLADWRRAGAIVAESGEFYRIRNEVEAQRRRWEAKRRGELLLPHGLPLAEAEAIAGKYAGELAPETLRFIAASRRRANRAQMLGWGAAVLFAAIAAGAIFEWQTARQERQRAEDNLGLARQTLRSMIIDVAEGLSDVTGVRIETIRTILDTVKASVDRLAATERDDPVLLTIRAGMWESFARTYLSAGDIADARRAAEEVLAIAGLLGTRNDPDAQHWLSEALSLGGDIKTQTGDHAGALQDYQQSFDIDRALAARAPQDAGAQRGLLVALDRMAYVKMQLGDIRAALADYNAALEIARKLSARDPANAARQVDLAVELTGLGDAKLRAGDRAGALAAYREGLGIRRKLAGQSPDDVRALTTLSVSLERIGDMELQDDPAAARRDFEESLGIRRKLAAKDPGSAEAQRNLANALGRLADLLLARDAAAALTLYEESRDIRRKLAVLSPDDARAQRDLAVAIEEVGRAKLQAGDRTAALALEREALEIYRRLAAQDRANMQAQADLANILVSVGRAEIGLGHPQAALDAYRESLGLRRMLVAKDLNDALAQDGVAECLAFIGDAEAALGQRPEAANAYRESAELRRKRIAAGAGTAQERLALVTVLLRLAPLLPDPEPAYREMLALLEGLNREGKLDAAQQQYLALLKKQFEAPQ